MRQETRIYIWLLVILFFAAGFRFYRYLQIKEESEAFLLKRDSIFYASKIKADSLFASLGSAETDPVFSHPMVNINSGSSEELQKIPGIGPAMSDRIIKFRKIHGVFNNIKDLIKVKGIGPKKLKKIEGFICF